MKAAITFGLIGYLVSGAMSLDSRAENFTCEETSVYKSGTADVGRCGYENFIACYEDVEQTCRSDSGNTNTYKFRRFTGACVKAVMECY